MHPFQIQGPSVTDGKARLRRTGRHFGVMPPAGTYKGPEGWLVLQVLAPQWDRLCAAASSIDLGDDPRFATEAGRVANREELVDTIEAWLQTFPTDGAALAPPRAASGASGSGHRSGRRPRARLVLGARGRSPSSRILSTDRSGCRGFPIRGSAIPRRATEPQAPYLGEHNDAVLGELLGYDAARVAELADTGVLHRSELG